MLEFRTLALIDAVARGVSFYGWNEILSSSLHVRPDLWIACCNKRIECNPYLRGSFIQLQARRRVLDAPKGNVTRNKLRSETPFCVSLSFSRGCLARELGDVSALFRITIRDLREFSRNTPFLSFSPSPTGQTRGLGRIRGKTKEDSREFSSSRLSLRGKTCDCRRTLLDLIVR